MTEHKWNYDSPRRGAAIPERQFGEFDACVRRCKRGDAEYLQVKHMQEQARELIRTLAGLDIYT